MPAARLQPVGLGLALLLLLGSALAFHRPLAPRGQQQLQRRALNAATPTRLATTTTALFAAADGSASSAAVTTWEAQEAKGFLPAPPQVAALLARLKEGKAKSIMFEETLKAIDAHYDYTPRRFINGALDSPEGTNAGSCKVLSMGILHGLDPATLLALFGEHYRSVLQTPKGSDHGNIRNLMQKGWKGVSFPDGLGLALKK